MQLIVKIEWDCGYPMTVGAVKEALRMLYPPSYRVTEYVEPQKEKSDEEKT